MSDKYSKFILFGIFLCLVTISFKIGSQTTGPSPISNVSVNQDVIVQIAPNRIGIKDNGSHTGLPGQLLIFEYDTTSKTFKYTGSLNYGYYIDHPEEFGIPTAQK